MRHHTRVCSRFDWDKRMASGARLFIEAVQTATEKTPVFLLPGRDVSLGDIGIFEDGEWIRKTSLKHAGRSP